MRVPSVRKGATNASAAGPRQLDELFKRKDKYRTAPRAAGLPRPVRPDEEMQSSASIRRSARTSAPVPRLTPGPLVLDTDVVSLTGGAFRGSGRW